MNIEILKSLSYQQIAQYTLFFFATIFSLWLAPISSSNVAPVHVDPALTAMSVDQLSVIVTAVDTETAVSAVEQVGGTVTHKLDIINSVGAQLTRAQRDRLANFETITRIYNNRTLEIASIQVETVLDDFNTISYSNNNGTQPWLGDWSESGESTNPDSGDIKIPNSYLRIRDNDRSIQRPVNLSGSSSAILSFDYRRVELDDSSDYVAIEISSDDGESWTELDRFAGPNNDSEYAATSYDISDYATSNTIIRFRTSPSLGRKDKLRVDNLLIEWIVNSSANSLAGSSDSSFNIIASDLSTHETVREEFNALSYNSSDGTQSWSNNWQEIGETDGAENGRIQIQPMAGQSSAGSNQAMWSGSSTPVYSAWDTSSFGEPNLAPSVGSHWRIMAGASAPTRDEKIVIGVESDNDITGEMWNGSSWNALPINPLGSVSQTYWRGFEVAYEQQSGDALLVWNDNPNLKYSVWTGSSWTTPATITAFPGNEPQQMRLAANPNSDEMVLVVNDASENDYALVWDGTSWGNLQNLDSSTGDDRIDIFVTYEQQSGNAMVVYGKSATSVYYRIWNGSSWSAESSIAAPSSTSGNVHRTTLAADPSSNRIVLGVVTFSQHIWLSVWDGSTWELATLASTTTSGEISSTVAAAFESQSGKALAAYGGNTSAVQYRAWDATNGWASEQTGFNVSNTPNSMMLDADPGSDQIMLSVQDSLGDLNFVLWDGASWDATNGLSTNTEGGGYMDHPFVFLWSQQQVGQGHCATTNCLTIGGLNQDFNGVGIIRQLDLSHAVEATLSFSYLRQANPSTAKVHIAVSDDGGTNWSSLATYTLDGDDNVQVSESFDLTAYMATDTQIRFLGEGAGSGEQVISFDNIQVAYTTNSAEMAVSTHDFIQLSGAEAVWEQNIDGDGITVAVIDTGHWSHPGLDLNSNGQQRLLAQYNAITDEMDMADSPVTTDESGHGTHVSSLILNSQDNGQGAYHGVAPDANLVSIKAFDANGTGAYPDVIRGIDWAVTHKDTYNIRILNLSFSALPQSNYWDDPLNQAVMQAWDAGIVVVASAGNIGPDPMSIGVPGNVPYVITVGAISDNYTTNDETDDILTSFSSTGPTVEGFVKPDITAPGGHIVGLTSPSAQLAQNYSQFHNGVEFFSMSGTSQATAVTSGVVALMLQNDPTLTPDDVKCRLMASAHTAVNDNGELAYSIFQQGAGQVNAYDAINNTESDCVNQGLNIAADLDGTEHYAGPVDQDEEGNFYIHGFDGYTWNGDYTWSEGYIWSDGAFAWSGGAFAWSGGAFAWSGGAFAWSGGAFAWSGGAFAWSGGAFAWSGGAFAWSGGAFAWSGSHNWTTSVTQIGNWVPQE